MGGKWMDRGGATSDSMCRWEFRGMIERSIDPVGFVDNRGTLLYANGRLRSLLGTDGKESTTRASLMDAAARCFRNKETVNVRLTHDREVRTFDVIAIPSRGDETLRPGSILALRDITAATQVEHQLTAALAEKRSLFNELHHRVKNNLMTIAALVSLKDRDVGDGVDLSDIQRQIESIAIVHDQLSLTDGTLEISLDEYLTTVFRSAVPVGIARATVECEEIVVPSKAAVSLGLIVNELATNAVKHGIDEDVAPPEVALRVGFDPVDRLSIEVSNTGCPFPLHHVPPYESGSSTPPHTGSMGLSLVHSLIDRFDGTFSIETEPRTVVTVMIPRDALAD